MERLLTLQDLASEVKPAEFSPEFIEEFSRYMGESIRQSRINEAKAIESASKVIIV